MAFWQHQINQKTGLPFQSKEEFDARVSEVSSKYDGAIGALQGQLAQLLPRADQKQVRAALARYIAAYGDPPSDPNELSKWGRNFARSINRFRMDEQRGWLEEAGLNPDTDWNSEQAQRIMAEKSSAIWGQVEGGVFDQFGTAEAHSEINPDLTGVALSSTEDADPGSVTGTKATDEQDSEALLRDFYSKLYNPASARRWAAIGANTARASQRASGLQGGLSDLAAAQASQDALFQYESAINQQKAGALGMIQGGQLQRENLAQQAAMFNAQQLSQYAQQQYGQRQQLGGMIGGAIGGIVGGVAQAYGVPGGAQIGASLGTAAGSAVGGGQAPGAYTVRSSKPKYGGGNV